MIMKKYKAFQPKNCHDEIKVNLEFLIFVTLELKSILPLFQDNLI